jgi:hypothetical protein
MSDSTNVSRTNGTTYQPLDVKKCVESIDWMAEFREWTSWQAQWKDDPNAYRMPFTDYVYERLGNGRAQSVRRAIRDAIDNEMQRQSDAGRKTGKWPPWFHHHTTTRFTANNDDASAARVDEPIDDIEPPMDKPEKEQPRKSRFRTRQQDKAAPPPVWLIPGLIEEGCDAALYAPLQFLKSFLALDILFALATGTHALGGALPVTGPGPCIYYAGEGYSDVIKHRAPAWEIAHRLEPYSVENVIFGNEAPYMNDRDGIEHDIAYLTEWLAGRPAKLIVIDTLNRALNGADEDRAHTAAMYLNTAKAIRERLGGSTLTVAHKSNKGDLDRGVRGSSAFEAGFDTVLEIRQHHKDEMTKMHTICVVVKKQKAGEDGACHYLQTRFIDNMEDGASSLVLVTVAEEVGKASLEQKPDGKKVTADLVETVLLGVTDGGYVSRAKLVEVLAKRLDKSTSAVEKALERGVKSGELQKFVIGHGKWSLPEIVAADANSGKNENDMSATVSRVLN